MVETFIKIGHFGGRTSTNLMDLRCSLKRLTFGFSKGNVLVTDKGARDHINHPQSLIKSCYFLWSIRRLT